MIRLRHWILIITCVATFGCEQRVVQKGVWHQGSPFVNRRLQEEHGLRTQSGQEKGFWEKLQSAFDEPDSDAKQAGPKLGGSRVPLGRKTGWTRMWNEPPEGWKGN